MGNEFVKSAAAIGNAPVTKAIGQVMQTVSDIKQVIPSVAGIFGPEAKAAAKVNSIILPYKCVY
jgi:hypothetical protein